MEVGKKTIMVVDDDAVVLKMAELSLQRGGYNVVKCLSGMSCLESLKFYEPDLILLDVEMPIMSGIQTLEIIKKNELLRDIPVMFLTGSKDADTVTSAKILGAVGYMVKPFIPQELVERVKKILKF